MSEVERRHVQERAELEDALAGRRTTPADADEGQRLMIHLDSQAGGGLEGEAEILPTEGLPGVVVKVRTHDGRLVPTEVTVRAPLDAGRGVTRQMLYQVNLQQILGEVAALGGKDQTPLMQLADEDLATARTGASQDERLRAVARIYNYAMAMQVPLHDLAERIGVHKKTFQRWARQAEDAGHLKRPGGSGPGMSAPIPGHTADEARPRAAELPTDGRVDRGDD